jgi:hypothetical protein
MKNLFFVPIIHAPADMGTIGDALSLSSASVLGRDVWEEHLKTVLRFWDSIFSFFNTLMIVNCKIYQDGQVTAGEEGLKVINEGLKQGSVNYKIISCLIARGAILIKTEDIALVRREYDYLKKITSAKTPREREAAGLRYRLAQRKLLDDRDNFIAGVIGHTLMEGDTGVLFIGAYHDVLARLPGDIQVIQVKELSKVREYHKILGNIDLKTQEKYRQLAEYLASPVLIEGTG